MTDIKLKHSRKRGSVTCYCPLSEQHAADCPVGRARYAVDTETFYGIERTAAPPRTPRELHTYVQFEIKKALDSFIGGPLTAAKRGAIQMECVRIIRELESRGYVPRDSLTITPSIDYRTFQVIYRPAIPVEYARHTFTLSEED